MDNIKLTSVPFSWNDNLSEEAMEDFESIRSKLPYGACQSIGMALAKLEMIENGTFDIDLDKESEYGFRKDNQNNSK